MKDSIKVSLTSEKDRYESVFKSLDLISGEINKAVGVLKKDDYVFIKPNCVSASRQLSATHLDALKAVIGFIRALWPGKIIIAEGTASGTTMDAFIAYHYNQLPKEFDRVEFLDLNYSESVNINLLDAQGKTLPIKVAKTLINCPLRISVSPPKTHDQVLVTLSIKNMAVGPILKEDKEKIHQGYPAINRNIANLFKYTFPHLAVLDGWQAMEGNGPVSGNKVESRFVLSSTNALAADVLATEMMGFNPLQVGYLNLLGAEQIRPKIEVVGREVEAFRFHFKPHQTYLEQINWL